MSERQLPGIIAGDKAYTLEAQEVRKEKRRVYNRNYRLRKATRAHAKATQRKRAFKGATKSFELEIQSEDLVGHLT